MKYAIACGCLLFLFVASMSFAADAERVLVTDFGAEPGSRKNTLAAVEAAILACRDKSDSGAHAVSLVFPKGQGQRAYLSNIDKAGGLAP